MILKSPSYRSNIDLAVKHYSSLFKLPSFRRILILLLIESIVLGFLSNVPLKPHILWIPESLLFGTCFFIATFLTDYFSTKLLLQRDVILNFRRCSFLSFASNMLLLIFVFTAHILFFHFLSIDFFIKIVSLGLFAALTLRFLTICVASFSNRLGKFFSAILQPLAFSLVMFFFHLKGSHINFIIIYFPLAIIFSMLGVQLFMKLLDKIGIKSLGIPSLKLFRAFLANWTESVEQPFEEILEQIGEEREIVVSSLIFMGKKSGRLKAIIVVPNLHPGPFKNVGSSPLPGLIQKMLEKEMGCIVSVPHGISGHELDLVSQKQNMKVIETLIKVLKEKPRKFFNRASPFFMIEQNGAKIGCQIFGEYVFLTLTLAPETMEDLPLELNEVILREAKRMGFPWAIVVDAHNSINGAFSLEAVTKPISRGAISALKRAVNFRNKMETLMVGAGKVVPKEFGIESGMGPGGITAILVKVGEQKTAYITMDGNNMISGLREKILSELKKMGIEYGEVFTTDTHVVNAVVLSERGYHPIGEVMDHGRVIFYARKAVSKAMENVEEAVVALQRVVVPKIKVVGERQINELSLLVNKAIEKIKLNLIIPILFGLMFSLVLIFL
ncbi:DUF2070 family protein [Candidatus Bathyarchaeota archaeon]|nr:DUF2070 family protein [Candidatus Bathyarchaeota archaeon]